MFGVLSKKQLAATAFAALLGSSATFTSAYGGGDIGGDCCADLEERVAELEVTTARKGNRKVSLTISGQVNKGIMYFDDGSTQNTYVVDNSNSSSRFRFHGMARIRPGWSAGYMVEIEFDTAESDAVTQTDDDGDSTDGALDLRRAEWWLRSTTLGRLSVGQGWFASGQASNADLSGTTVVSSVTIPDVGAGLFFRTTGGVITTRSIGNTASDYTLTRGDRVRYDTPTIAGFSLSASWGEDDIVDGAIYLNKRMGQFKVMAGFGYADDSDETNNYQQYSGSISLLHIPTGLSLTFAGGDRDTSGVSRVEQFWYGKAGLTRKFRSVGATSISVDYYYGDEVWENTGEMQHWGVQLVQNIDAAAMELYAGWSQNSYDTASVNYQDLSIFMAGARIRF